MMEKIVLVILYIVLALAIIVAIYGACGLFAWFFSSLFDDITGTDEGFLWFFSN